MKDIREYVEQDSEWGIGCNLSYSDILDSFGYEIVHRVDVGYYSGDTCVLLHDAEQGYGYLVFGWGSCSGCDALQACDSIEEIEELQQQLYSSIKWDTRAGMLKYFKEHDWETDWIEYYWEDGAGNFVRDCIETLQFEELSVVEAYNKVQQG